MDNNFMLCASPEFVRHQGLPETVESLSRFQCIMYSYSGWRNWYLLDKGCQKLNINGSIRVNSVNGQKQLILNQGGVALIPFWAVQQELKTGSLVQLLKNHSFSPQEAPSSTWAIYLNRRLVSGKVTAFLEYLSQHLS